VEEAEGKLRGALEPTIAWVSSVVSPLKGSLTFESMRGPADADREFSQLTRALKIKLSER
jgi:hypothetical protein